MYIYIYVYIYICLYIYMRVSTNGDTPNWMVYSEKSKCRWMIWSYPRLRHTAKIANMLQKQHFGVEDDNHNFSRYIKHHQTICSPRDSWTWDGMMVPGKPQTLPLLLGCVVRSAEPKRPPFGIHCFDNHVQRYTVSGSTVNVGGMHATHNIT